ncbi:GNAT family acetyltransferase [Lentzea sp. NBRC 105346]|uniref:GNAT family N-acetyltransferase n=1 Tax=Lentzea sp. NBRC 105346 TaxID=3032205 RepID=UPI0024A267EC|nr:GNAT family N-acetyltransferase [Lentzea sp. NBRC 105346]GLZ30239.1 GNAT family acetyltransferase [Lentzea sp. NBRC 105346]
MTTIRTERLLLRPVSITDLETAVQIMADPETNRFNPMGTPSAERVETMLQNWISSWQTDGVSYWAIELAETGAVIGFGGLRHEYLAEEATLNLFYRFTPAAWGQGYAPEMGRAAIAWADREHPHRPVVIVTQPPNMPAQRVAEKLGFVFTGEHEAEYGTDIVYRRQEVMTN